MGAALSASVPTCNRVWVFESNGLKHIICVQLSIDGAKIYVNGHQVWLSTQADTNCTAQVKFDSGSLMLLNLRFAYVYPVQILEH